MFYILFFTTLYTLLTIFLNFLTQLTLFVRLIFFDPFLQMLNFVHFLKLKYILVKKNFFWLIIFLDWYLRRTSFYPNLDTSFNPVLFISFFVFMFYVYLNKERLCLGLSLSPSPGKTRHCFYIQYIFVLFLCVCVCACACVCVCAHTFPFHAMHRPLLE